MLCLEQDHRPFHHQGKSQGSSSVNKRSTIWIFRIIIMPYKSTNKFNTISTRILFPLLILVMFLALRGSAQSQCAKKPFPSNISLRANESIIINLDDYFDGNNLSFKVTPNSSYSAIEPTYQCTPVGTQQTGKIIASRYFLFEGAQTIALLTESPFSESGFTFVLYQILRPKPTILNIPKENIAKCLDFDIKMINSTHFSPTIDCNFTAKNLTRALMTAIAEIGSPYADWKQIEAPLFINSTPVVRIELADDVLIRGIFTATSSYLQIWLWSEQAMQIVGVLDKTFLGIKNFNIKSMKLYGSLIIVLDYQSGLHLFRIRPTKTLQIIGFIFNPFYEEFEYNPITGMLYLAKKGKIVSSLLNPSSLTLVMTGDSYNIYKYEHIRNILITDTTIVALGESALNIFRKIGSSSDTRHYSLYLLKDSQAVYTRLISDGFTILLILNSGNTLQVSSCRVRAPFLKLVTPKGNTPTIVTATSLLDRQQSICAQNFTFQPDLSIIDDIYDNGYRVDNEVIYANQQGQGMLQLSKYGIGKNLIYSIKTITGSIVQSDTKIKKSLPVNCSFGSKPVLTGGNISFLHSWQNLVLVQFSVDNSLRYYICNQASCASVRDQFRLKPITHISHETIERTKNKTDVLEAYAQESQNVVNIIVQRFEADIVKNILINQTLCTLSFEISLEELNNITQIQIYNGLLYLVMPYRKEIKIFDLRQERCPNVLNLNKGACPWGYFAPRSIHFNRGKGSFPTQTFLIRQWDQILTVRLEKQETLRPILVTKNILPLVVSYTLIYTFPYLLAFDLTTNRAYTFYFDDESIIQYLREIPLGGKTLKSTSNSHSDFGKLLQSRHLALTLQDQASLTKYSTIFKIDQLISEAMQYLTYTIKPEELMTWVSFDDVWYAFRLTLLNNPTLAEISCKGNITYLNPTIQLFFGRTPTAYEEYSENVSLRISTADKVRLHEFKITLSNVGDVIKRGSKFPSRGDSVQASQIITINDKKWFSGSIFNYEFQCPDCGDRITFKQKVTLEDKEPLPVPSNRFWLQRQGEVVKILMGSFLVELEYNYTVWPIASDDNNSSMFGLHQATILTTTGGNCLHAIPTRRQFEIIALCQREYQDEGKAFYLSLISTASYKGFVVAETILNFDINAQPRLIVKNDIIIIYTPQVAYIMTLWQVEDQVQFIELDQIDHQDIQSHICSVDLTFNNTLEAVPITEILFSLIVTECSSSIYLTSFLIYIEKEEYIDEDGKLKSTKVPNLHVNSAQNVNLIAKFGQSHIQIPSEATVVQTIASRSINKDELSVLTVFDKFHTYEFILYLSQSGVSFNITINKVFYKYGNYEAVSAEKGKYLAIKYKSKLLGRQERYGFFDIDGLADATQSMSEYYMFSGYSLQNSGDSGQEIPWTFQGQTLIHFNGENLQLLNITNILQGYIKRLNPDGQSDPNDPLYTQKIQITANNIASARSAIIVLKAIDKFQFAGWQIALMVIGSLVILISSIFALRFCIRQYKKHKKMTPLLLETPLEDAELEYEQQERMSGRINMSLRGSTEPLGQ